jgi:hypothetical protein
MTPNKETTRDRVESSRDTLAGAGWDCQQPGSFKDLMPPSARRSHFSWLNPRTLWQARRNDLIAHLLSDPVNHERRRWIAEQRYRKDIPEDFVIDRSDLDPIRFLILGDTGEGDESQFALVPPLLECGKDTQFMIICSDVVYPAGDVNEYLDKFYWPYKDYPKPIYALPGNHDWYDGLNGFMVHFCGAEPSERSLGSNWVLRRLWRRAARARPGVLKRCRTLRPELEEHLKQPGPYFAIDTGPLRIVSIDTGITGKLDHEQGEWLRWVSSESLKPKILLTGKPIYVDGGYYPGCIEGSTTTADDIVRAPEHNYVAAIGGDVHNYQRYPVKVGNRIIQYVVSGGGGAYMSDTHRIPKVTPHEVPGVDEEDFKCYPRRGDSLSIYSRVIDRRLFFGLGLFEIDPSEAVVLMGTLLGIVPSRQSDRYTRPSTRSKLVAKLMRLLPSRGRGLLEPFFYPFFSEVFDWDDPPFFKNFLRLETTKSKLTITCYGVSGCGSNEKNPPVEDYVEAQLEWPES